MTYPSILDTHLRLIDRGASPIRGSSPFPRSIANFCSSAIWSRATAAALYMEVDVAADQIEAETRHVGRLAQRLKSPLVGAIGACRP